ncbi:unnamed protein product [Leptidea sinapis]|uniref:Uncharacterized protein n=2 Tax=Leptidea sinapis TaxID=189913 RepID=A0A5E4QHE0_9NEOP|nr:unnamed protein product [Leptidea sinapis]
MSFYNDIAALEKETAPSTAENTPERDRSGEKERIRESQKEKARESEKDKVKESERDKDKGTKKKSKVKITNSIGMKHRTVSSLVAKWQQVAEEVCSD